MALAPRHWSEETRLEPLESAVAKIKAALELAYFECRSDDADALHDDLISIEWRIRAARKSGVNPQ